MWKFSLGSVLRSWRRQDVSEAVTIVEYTSVHKHWSQKASCTCLWATIGVLMFQYDEVWRFVQRFSEWSPYEHRVVAYMESPGGGAGSGQYVPIPVNIDTVNQLLHRNIAEPHEMKVRREVVLELQWFCEQQNLCFTPSHGCHTPPPPLAINQIRTQVNPPPRDLFLVRKGTGSQVFRFLE